jgi:hypothetical protein
MENIKSKTRRTIQRKTADMTIILPFVEQASAQRGRPEADTNDYFCASSLFCIFTADIIRQDKKFVR